METSLTPISNLIARVRQPFIGALAIFAVFSALLLQGAKAGPTIDLPGYGFEIEALDAQVGDATATALMMFLPMTEGFGPNINVNIQPYKGTMAEYAKLSRGQFEGMKWKVVSERLTPEGEWRIEYSGSMNGEDLHFYARALPKNDHVYLVTATAKESQWAAVGAKLRRHVDSLKLK